MELLERSRAHPLFEHEVSKYPYLVWVVCSRRKSDYGVQRIFAKLSGAASKGCFTGAAMLSSWTKTPRLPTK